MDCFGSLLALEDWNLEAEFASLFTIHQHYSNSYISLPIPHWYGDDRFYPWFSFSNAPVFCIPSQNCCKIAISTTQIFQNELGKQNSSPPSQWNDFSRELFGHVHQATRKLSTMEFLWCVASFSSRFVLSSLAMLFVLINAHSRLQHYYLNATRWSWLDLSSKMGPNSVSCFCPFPPHLLENNVFFWALALWGVY